MNKNSDHQIRSNSQNTQLVKVGCFRGCFGMLFTSTELGFMCPANIKPTVKPTKLFRVSKAGSPKTQAGAIQFGIPFEKRGFGILPIRRTFVALDCHTWNRWGITQIEPLADYDLYTASSKFISSPTYKIANDTSRSVDMTFVTREGWKGFRSLYKEIYCDVHPNNKVVYMKVYMVAFLTSMYSLR